MKTRNKWLLTAVLALAVALSVGVSAMAASAEVTLTKLDAYESYAIPEDMRHEAEFNNNRPHDEGKRLDYSLRRPSDNGYMNGNPMTNPQPNLGNGVNVAPGTTKLKLAYGGGMMRLRYGYTVNMESVRLDIRFLDFGGQNGHLNFAFSSSSDAFTHPQVTYPGFRVIIYRESPTRIQATLRSGSGDTAIPGITDQAFTVSETPDDTWCFSGQFEGNSDGSLTFTLMNSNNTHTFTVPKNFVDGTKIVADPQSGLEYGSHEGETFIGVNCDNGSWVDDNGTNTQYLTCVLKISDALRTQYETDTMLPVKNALEAYSATAIEAAAISSIDDVKEWIAKRDAIDNNKVNALRVSDADLLKVSQNVSAANTKLKEKAGSVVNTYIKETLTALDTEFATAKSDTEYTTITTKAACEALSDKYSAAWVEYNQTYASIITETAAEKQEKEAILNGVAAARNRLRKHVAIYEVEHADMSTAEAITAAKAKYAEINTDGFKSEINGLNTTEAVKTDLLNRLTAIQATITAAESQLNKADIIDKQIKNYEDAAVTTIAEIRSALTVKALIEDYSDLSATDKASFDTRIATKDTALQTAAYNIIKPDVDTVKTLTDAGVTSYRKAQALKNAVLAVANTDLLSSEKLTEVQGIVTAAQAAVKAEEDALDEANLRVGHYAGNTPKIDVELTQNGAFRYSAAGTADSLLYDQKLTLGENGISVKFSVEAWAYMNGDGQGFQGNNATIFFSSKNKDGGRIASRGTADTLAIMYWTQVGEFFVKSYRNGSDVEVDAETMQAFEAGDGSYVVVTLTKNASRNRYEIATTYYAANGTEIDAIRNLIPFDEVVSATSFDDGVYVGFQSYMDKQDWKDNVWLIESIRSNDVTEIPVSGVSVTSDKTSIAVGESAQLSATVSPDDATDKTVTYTSSDESVATVDANGKVTALKEGTVMITATAGGESASVTIRVTAKKDDGENNENGKKCGGTLGGGYALVAALLLGSAIVLLARRKKTV